MLTNNANLSLESRLRRPLAVLMAMSLGVAACGSGQSTGADVQADQSQESGLAATVDPPLLERTDGGPEYGDSLEDWTHETQQLSTGSALRDNPANLSGYETLAWEDLVPPGYSAEEVFKRYEERLAAVAEGSGDAEALFAEMEAEFDENNVNEDLAGKKIQLAGFVAPLTYDEDVVTEFLLVPYFGACIHVPAPPPNQTIIVSLDKANGLKVEDTWGAVWVAGTLTTDSSTTGLATANYSFVDATTGVYEI